MNRWWQTKPDHSEPEDWDFMKKSAELSECGHFRYTLGREWDERPCLVVVMFNPSTADNIDGDQTVNLLCHIASHNGYGKIVVVNAIPFRSSDAGTAARYAKENDSSPQMLKNWQHVVAEVSAAGAVLFAWGALAELSEDRLGGFTSRLMGILPEKVALFCLGKTKAGFPLHPMARGKLKLPKNAPLYPW